MDIRIGITYLAKGSIISICNYQIGETALLQRCQGAREAHYIKFTTNKFAICQSRRPYRAFIYSLQQTTLNNNSSRNRPCAQYRSKYYW